MAPLNFELKYYLKKIIKIVFDDAFFLSGTGLERVGVIGPDLDCWRAGL